LAGRSRLGLAGERIMITQLDHYIKADEIIEMILQHSRCTKYHDINGRKASCLDMVLKELGYEK
jgi:hypothetical protein